MARDQDIQRQTSLFKPVFDQGFVHDRIYGRSPLFLRENEHFADHFALRDLGLEDGSLMFPDLVVDQAFRRDPLSYNCECESLGDRWIDWTNE
jgi:hypothetical protein